MVSNVEYRPDERGWRQIRNSPELTAACVAVAKEGAQYAQGISPRESGDYASSFEVNAIKAIFDDGPGRGPRSAAELVNTSDHAAAVEWQHDHHALRRTLEHMAGPG